MNQSDILKMREDIMEDQRHEEIEKAFNDLETYDAVFENDPVNNPHHYKSENMEVIEVIQAYSPDPYSYYMGNVIKYVLRHMEKGNEKQDLEKARWYLNKMIGDWDE